MLTYIIRRLLYSIPVLVATSFLIFTFVSITGDPLARLRANANITAEQIHSIEHSKNLDKPVIVRYGYWIKDAATKQFGTTLFGNRKIWPDLRRVIAHCALSTAIYSRFMRASMLEVLNSDYVRTARAKGLIERRVVMRHAFRNALIPLITVIAIDFGALFAGAIVTETIFTLDGMGFYFVNSLFASDPYPVMAWLMVVATMVIIFNLIADILYGVFDPRIRYE